MKLRLVVRERKLAKNRLNGGFIKLRNYPHYLIPFPVFSFCLGITPGWVKGGFLYARTGPFNKIFFFQPPNLPCPPLSRHAWPKITNTNPKHKHRNKKKKTKISNFPFHNHKHKLKSEHKHKHGFHKHKNFRFSLSK